MRCSASRFRIYKQMIKASHLLNGWAATAYRVSNFSGRTPRECTIATIWDRARFVLFGRQINCESDCIYLFLHQRIQGVACSCFDPEYRDAIDLHPDVSDHYAILTSPETS